MSLHILALTCSFSRKNYTQMGITHRAIFEFLNFYNLKIFSTNFFFMDLFGLVFYKGQVFVSNENLPTLEVCFVHFTKGIVVVKIVFLTILPQGRFILWTWMSHILTIISVWTIINLHYIKEFRYGRILWTWSCISKTNEKFAKEHICTVIPSEKTKFFFFQLNWSLIALLTPLSTYLAIEITGQQESSGEPLALFAVCELSTAAEYQSAHLSEKCSSIYLVLL